MRKNLLLILGLFTVLCIGVNAEMTATEQTEPEMLINGGYSVSTAEEAMIVKNRATGKPCEPLYEQKHNKFVRFCQSLYTYLDPAQDNVERYHHDIQMYPHPTDL